jgi:hypothetical protein
MTAVSPLCVSTRGLGSPQFGKSRQIGAVLRPSVGQSMAFGCSSAFVGQLDLSGWPVTQPFNQAGLRHEPEASGRDDLFHGPRPGSGCASALDRTMAHGQVQLALVCNLQCLHRAFLATCSASHEIKTMLRPVFDASRRIELLVPNQVEDLAHQECVSTMHVL